MLFCTVAISGFLMSLATQNGAALTSTWSRCLGNSGQELVDWEGEAGGQKELGVIGVRSCTLMAKEGKESGGRQETVNRSSGSLWDRELTSPEAANSE